MKKKGYWILILIQHCREDHKVLNHQYHRPDKYKVCKHKYKN